MDELKPDTGDRHPSHSQKISSVSKISVSRQHMMIGVGILVLLLLVLAIGSILKSLSTNSAKHTLKRTRPSQGQRTLNINDSYINTTGSKKINYLATPLSKSEQSEQLATSEYSGSTSSIDLQKNVVSLPSPQQTEVQTMQIPENQQRIELPSHLNNKNSPSNTSAAHVTYGNSSLPITPKISAPSDVETHRQVSTSNPIVMSIHQKSHDSNKAKATSIHKAPLKPAVKKASGISIPTKNFTLQLSSASRPDTLNAWAKKQNLSDYHIYQTMHNSQPWYVLIMGSYVTSNQAKHAVALLPHEVRAQNPWVKSFSQIKKEAGR